MKTYVAIALLAFCVVAYAQDKKDNTCQCHIRMHGEPAGKDMIPDVFKNDMKLAACNEEGQNQCKKFCIDTEKEKTHGDLNVVSAISKVPYGDILCGKIQRDVDQKTLKMVSEVKCGAESKMMDAGNEFPQKLTCKAGKFVKM